MLVYFVQKLHAVMKLFGLLQELSSTSACAGLRGDTCGACNRAPGLALLLLAMLVPQGGCRPHAPSFLCTGYFAATGRLEGPCSKLALLHQQQ